MLVVHGARRAGDRAVPAGKGGFVPSTVTRSVSSSTPVPSSLTANPIGVAPTTVEPGSGLRWAITGGVTYRRPVYQIAW